MSFNDACVCELLHPLKIQNETEVPTVKDANQYGLVKMSTDLCTHNVKALALLITMYSKIKIISLHLYGIKSSENIGISLNILSIKGTHFSHIKGRRLIII